MGELGTIPPVTTVRLKILKDFCNKFTVPDHKLDEMIHAIKANEQKRIFEEWLTQHRGLLFKVVRAYAFNPHDQDDLFQEGHAKWLPFQFHPVNRQIRVAAVGNLQH